jgi:hypothetical protein
MLQAFGFDENPPSGDLVEEGRGKQRRAADMAVETGSGGFDHGNIGHGNPCSGKAAARE